MLHCPTCHEPITADAIVCPHCHQNLKAFGHAGIDLHRAEGDRMLCDTCTYHADDTCTYPQRPYAKACTLYRSDAKPTSTPDRLMGARPFSAAWWRRYQGWLALAGLLLGCLLWVLSR